MRDGSGGSQGLSGSFEGHQDVGTVLHPGSTSYDAAKQSYTVTGSGENMWFGMDDFQFAWKKMSGDVAISADIAFVGDKGKQPSQGRADDQAEPGREFARGGHCAARRWTDVAAISRCGRRGRSRGAIECRRAEAACGWRNAATISMRLFRVRMGSWQPAGASTKLVLNGPFYVGIGVSAHDKDATETAVFSNVKIEALARQARSRCFTARWRRCRLRRLTGGWPMWRKRILRRRTGRGTDRISCSTRTEGFTGWR